ncbi:hypothetical protein Tco_0739307 [Tanacetum coccineum]
MNIDQDNRCKWQIAVNQNGYNAVQNAGNQVGQNAVQNPATQEEGYVNGNNGNQIRCYNCRGLGHYARNYTEFDLMVAACDINEIEEVNANCILMDNLQQALGTQTDKAPIYDSGGSAEYGTYQSQMKETNADLTTKLARYKGQEKCFEFNQQKFDELENGYRKSVYQEQSLTKKINALYLSSAKQIMTLNEEIENLNNQLSKEKSSVSYLQQEKERRKSDFKTRKDELLDKLILSEKKIKELDNILVKTGQSIQMMHMLSPKPDSFYHNEQKMALGYQNTFYLNVARKFLNEVKDTIVTFQCVVQHRMSLNANNWSSHVHQEFHKIFKDEIAPISLAKEADESLDKIMVFENENESLLRAVVSRDIMSIVKSPSV